MANTLIAFSTNSNTTAHTFEIYDEAGAVVAGGSAVAGAGDFNFVITPPATLADGYYSVAMNRASNNSFRWSGDFYWFGGNVVSSAEYNYLTTTQARFDAIDTAQGTTATALTNLLAGQVTIQNAQTVLLAAINGLSIPTVAAIAVAVEAALLDDGDGAAFRSGLAATIEAALANEADGNATVAVFQGAVAAALTAYTAPTLAQLQTAQSAIQTDIAALENLSAADVLAQITSYGTATTTDVTAVSTLINALNNLSVSEITAAIAAYDAATGTELASAVTTILNAIGGGGGGLTAAQDATLTLIKDIAEADEVYGPGTAQKLLKGTSTVLVDKVVNSNTACVVNTTITEV